jgi:lysophospholipase L1-like esterase
MYGRLAADLQVAFVPDLLAGVAGNPERMFPDALHPNAAGQGQLAENVRPALESVLAGIVKSGFAAIGNDPDARR